MPFSFAGQRCDVLIDVKDGKLKWKKKWNQGVYVAGLFGETVLVVGRKSCRALSLADGKEQWLAETGTPSGLGAISNGRYYLRLKGAAGSKMPEISVLDIASGKIVQHISLGANNVPGNLALSQDRIISQTATTISAYPLPD